MAHDAAFVAGIREIRDGVMRLVCGSVVLSAEPAIRRHCSEPGKLV
jgi:hypothetical protein